MYYFSIHLSIHTSFVFPPTHLSIHSSPIHPPTHISNHLPTYRRIHPPTQMHRSTHSPTYPSFIHLKYSCIYPPLTHLPTYPPIYPPTYLLFHPPFYLSTYLTISTHQSPNILEFLLHVMFCAKPWNGLLGSLPGRKRGANRGSPQREIDKPACSLLSPFVAWTLPNVLTSRVSGQTMMKCRWRWNEAQASSRAIRGKLICLPHREPRNSKMRWKMSESAKEGNQSHRDQELINWFS